MTTLRMFNRNLPSSGGGYFRLLPYAFSRWMLNRVNEQATAKPRSFISTRGRWTPGQPRVAGIDAEDPLQALRQHPPHGRAACSSCCATSAGVAWTRSSSAAQRQLPARSGRRHPCLPLMNVLRWPLATSAALRLWDAFVLACPQATFFHRAGWQSICSDVFRHDTYLPVRRQRRHGRIVGRVAARPCDQAACLFGNSLMGLPFAVYGGVPRPTPETAAAFAGSRGASPRQAAESRPSGIAQRAAAPHRLADAGPVRHLSQSHPADEEANMLAIPRKQRAMVRKGIKNGLVSEH